MEKQKICLHSRYEILSGIDAGTYGSVYKAYDKETKTYVAIKRFTNEDSNGIGIHATTLREISMLNQLNHKNILKILHVANEGPKFTYIMEYCDCSLNDLISSYSLTQPNDQKNLFKQLMEAINYIHLRNIIHRDIKPQNILLQGNVIKLADFGSSRYYSNSRVNRFTPKVFPSLYIPPEVTYIRKINGDSDERIHYTTKVDIFACGLVLLQMCHYEDICVCLENEKQNLTNHTNEYFISQFLYSSGIIELPFLQLLSGLLHFNPESRWTSQDVLESEWFL